MASIKLTYGKHRSSLCVFSVTLSSRLLDWDPKTPTEFIVEPDPRSYMYVCMLCISLYFCSGMSACIRCCARIDLGIIRLGSSHEVNVTFDVTDVCFLGLNVRNILVTEEKAGIMEAALLDIPQRVTLMATCMLSF